MQLARLLVDARQAARLRTGLALDGPAGEALALDPTGGVIAILRDGHPHIVFNLDLPEQRPGARIADVNEGR